MRDEASLRRLVELGIEPWALRGRGPRDTAVTSPAAASPVGDPPIASTPAGGVLVLAKPGTPATRAILADVLRALRLAGLEATLAAADAGGCAAAAAVLMFGQDAARRAGTGVSADRQRQIGWVVAPDLDDLIGNAPARRALWSELRRLAETCRCA
ncbi:MAG: hypothetical protein J0H15_02980 [Xanthomonadales bacterium]|nr:hypothetical protein [Xanthomonadales bacterium]